MGQPNEPLPTCEGYAYESEGGRHRAEEGSGNPYANAPVEQDELPTDSQRISLLENEVQRLKAVVARAEEILGLKLSVQ